MAMWNRLLEFIRNHDGHFVIFGDLNEVRDESERYGTDFCRSAANVFNAFIDDTCLFEPVLGGHVKVTALPRGWFSVSNSIIVHCEKVDYVGFILNFFIRGYSQDGQHVVPFSTLSQEDNMELEKPVTLEEIRAAVWDCGSQKSPGPDGFSFLFLKSYWELLKEDVGNAVRCVFDSFVMPRGVNSSFITLIPKISNPIHIKDFRPFANRSSVLVNGSPSNEFSIKRGLRQGDLLSPFLFIIVMEGLRIAMQNVVCSGLIREAVIGTSGHKNSHLFYADDMVIISYWNNQDMSNIIRVLQVFDLASGLKINVSKSNVLGLGVSSQDVKDMASDTCCGPAPLKLYGLLFSWGKWGDKEDGVGLMGECSIGCTIWMLIRIACSRITEFMMLRPDSWRWNLEDDGIFTVHVTRTHIDACMLPSISPCTSWLKVLPRKVNVFIWRFILDRLPTRLNLSLRGIEIPSIECPICNSGMESIDHIFFDCEVASNIWCMVRVWTDIDMPSFSSWFDWSHWFEDWRASKSDKDRVH
ncbi:RNA-directed DNA polymerase, eukaryota, reverse transcriptase zinc-binding domain protein, partial [Tanacetum coccineum]